MQKKVHYYKTRLFPGGHDRFEVALTKKVVGVGWSKASKLGHTKEEIMQALNKEYNFKNKQSLSVTAGYFVRLQEMKIGDRILIPYNNETVTIVEVIGPYRFDQKLAHDYGMGHVVDIKELKTISVNHLSRGLRGSVGTMQTISNLSQYSEKIETLIQQTPVSNTISVESFETETFTYGSESQSITLTLSTNITNQTLQSFIDKVIENRKNM